MKKLYEKRTGYLYVIAFALTFLCMTAMPQAKVFAKTYIIVNSGESDASFEIVEEQDTGEYGILGYNGSDSVVTFPSEYDGHPITFIRNIRSESLVGAVLPDTLKVVDEYAFSDCPLLSAVSIPEGITAIGNGAFHGCTLLNNVVLPSTCVSIGDHAFYGCSSLRTIDFGNCDVLTEIQDAAFQYCSSVSRLVLPEKSPSFKVGIACFEGCKKIETLTIPKGMSGAGERAFYGCEALATINLNSYQFNLISATNEA